MGTFIKITKVFAWLQIAVVPAIVGAGIGFYLWSSIRAPWHILTGVTCTVTGIVAGVYWANKVARKHGTVEFISKVSATTELDDRN